MWTYEVWCELGQHHGWLAEQQFPNKPTNENVKYINIYVDMEKMK